MMSEGSRMASVSSDGRTSADPSKEVAGGIAAEISNSIVSLLKEYSGRGPTKARTYLHERMVICVIENALTRGEQQMAQHGEEEQAVESRRTYQRLIREEAKTAVEELTGRRVVALLSDNALEPDVGIEAFVFGDETPPAGNGEPSDFLRE